MFHHHPFNMTAWKRYGELAFNKPPGRTNAHFPPFNSGIMLSNVDLFVWWPYFLQQGCTSCLNHMYIYATHMYICSIYFHQNKSCASIYQRNDSFKMLYPPNHSIWKTANGSLVPVRTEMPRFRFLTVEKLCFGTGLILDLRMWKDYKILVKITNEKGSCLAENIFIYYTVYHIYMKGEYNTKYSLFVQNYININSYI